MIKMGMGEQRYFYCNVEEVNFPIRLQYLNRLNSVETIFSFKRQRPDQSTAFMISREHDIDILYPIELKPKKHLQASGMVLQIQKHIDEQKKVIDPNV